MNANNKLCIEKNYRYNDSQYVYYLGTVYFSRDVVSQLSSISGASSTRGGTSAASAGPTAERRMELLLRVVLFTGDVIEGGFLTTQVSKHSTSSAIYNVLHC